MKDSKTISLYLNTATKAFTLGAKKGSLSQRFDMGNSKKALERTHLGISLLGDCLHFKLADVDKFYCLLGPGSNTGIRLGLTIPKTIYALNPKIKIYGIPTMDLLTLVHPVACLSDRNGNLFYAKREEDKVTYQRVDKKDIPSLEEGKIVVEKQDCMAIESLSSHELIYVDVLSLMMEYELEFKDYSHEEENYLPEYVLKI